MAATTMHFGPEWMRKPLSRPQQPSPPPNSQSGLSSYSALVSTVPDIENDKQDDAHPFRYTKEELLKIYKESPRGGLGLEVERWEGVVREIGTDPVALREMSEIEKKLFSGPLNSELRRRQSTDYLSPLNTSLGNERPRLNHSASSATGSPLRERYPALKRRDSNADSPTVPMTRKQSLSSLNSPSIGSRAAALPSPRKGPGYPSFDGVLSSGESWSSRRRPSEAKAGGVAREPSGEAEEKPEPIPEDASNGHEQTPNNLSKDGQPASNTGNGGNSLNSSSGGAQQDPGLGHAVNPGNTAQDLAAVEWSYKDPTGNIQGPFRGDLMQKWYDDGYFTLDLPMKRTQLDRHWTTLMELTRRASVPDKVFLCALLDAVPPGLTHSRLSEGDEVLTRNPYQPSPIRALRSSTLDSLNGTNPSNSPVSAVGHFGNNSPDSLAFTNRMNAGYTEPSHLGFQGGLDMTSPLRQRHIADIHESPLRLHSPSYNTLLGQGLGYDSFGAYPGFTPVQSSPWGTPSQPYGNYGHNVGFGGNAYGPGSGYGIPQQHQMSGGQMYNNVMNQHQSQQVQNQGYFDPLPVVNGVLNEADTVTSPQTAEQYSPVDPNPDALVDRNGFSQTLDNATVGSPTVTRIQTAWDVPVDGPARRPGAFDTPQPAALNTTIPIVSSQSSPWGQPIEPSLSSIPSGLETSSWSPQDAAGSKWPTPVEAVASVTQQAEAPLDAEWQQPIAEPVSTTGQSPEPPQAEPVTTSKTKAKARKAAAAAAAATITVPDPLADAGIAAEHPSPISSQPAKAPWAQTDKKKGKASTTISLREIQETEAKLAEARKEKERARLATAASVAANDARDDIHSFTASWGLPTSQAGSRSAASVAKDASTASVPSTVNPTAAVWTTASKAPVAKKTMKEIQEEEERRKRSVAAKEPSITVPVKRGYADQATKISATPPAVATTSGGAWVTVGASGKTTAPITPAARPAASVISSAPIGHATPAKAPALAATRSAASVARPAATPGVKVEEFPVTPSHEFLKWLSESLKGLNSSVNVEEIISMLLSFSLDPDPTTVEIISDTIYASSTTLDGRRFAADFIAKRKADAANRAKGGNAAKGPAKPISIAEVVKATPKAQQSEWGFKVVNKKKKGGRS